MSGFEADLSQEIPKCSVPGVSSKSSNTEVAWDWSVGVHLCHLGVKTGAVVSTHWGCPGLHFPVAILMV